MNITRKNILRGLMLGGICSLLVARLGAAGTAANTSVSNQATINYSVGGVAQTAINSNTLAFVVDRKVNLTVVTTDSAAVNVTPGSTGNVLAFTMQNTGNSILDFALAATARSGGTGAFGGTDNKDAASVAVFVESGATLGYQSGEDTATYVDELAADGTKTIYIIGNFASGTYANGDIASYHLLVTARAGGTGSSLGAALTETSGADTAGTMDTVFADAQGSDTGNDATRDAKFSDDSDFIIASSVLTVVKSSTVISDPSNSTTNPKAIPGAIIEYTITVSNGSGGSTATGIAVTDNLNTEITAGTIAFNLNTYAAGKGLQVTAPNINSGSALGLTNASDGDQGTWNSGTNVVTVTGIQLAASESATVKFRVTIQ